MNNADMPAMAITIEPTSEDIHLAAIRHEYASPKVYRGFTKREQACLTMGVADTDCAELDAIITKGNKQRLAGLAMQGMIASPIGKLGSVLDFDSLAYAADNQANALLKALEKENE
jgi:hypothetical protein